MWGTFFLGTIVCFFLLYVPGYLVFRIIGFSRFLSFVSAPLASMSEYGATAALCSLIGIPCSWWGLFFGWSICGALFFFVKEKIRVEKPSKISCTPDVSSKCLRLNVFLYLSISLIITGFFFIKTLDGPASFVAGSDATTHLNVIQQFVETGGWSSFQNGTYYPNGYSQISAMISQILKTSAPFSTNVLMTVILFAIYPLSMLGFFTVCFEKHPRVILCGSVAVLALTAYPWNMLQTDQIGPNLFGFSMVPLGLMFALLITRSKQNKKNFVAVLVCLLIFIMSTVFTHPCAFFTTMVLLIPYIICLIVESNGKFIKDKSFVARISTKMACIILFLILVSIVWILLFKCPLLQSVTSFNWPAWQTPQVALEWAVTLSFADNPAQWICAFLVLVGIVFTIYKRQYIWISIAFGVFCFMFIVGISSDSLFKQILTGFWYTATRRLASSAAIIAIPLLCLGLYVIIQMADYSIKAIASRKNRRLFSSLSSSLILLAFLIINFFPSFTIPGPTGTIITPFGYFYEKLQAQNMTDNSIIDKKERDFLKQVKEVTGDDLVFNLPYDGSAYGYSLEQINTYESRMAKKSDDKSSLLQKRLNEISDDETVQEAAKDIGVKYILFLDYGLGENASIYTANFKDGEFDNNAWTGFLAISDETPGIELVLKDEDMRLYKIDEQLVN